MNPINSLIRTQKKPKTNLTQASRKLIRRSSSKSQKSLDNKKIYNNQNDAPITFIKTPKIGQFKIKTQPSDFFKQLAQSMHSIPDNQSKQLYKQSSSTMKKKSNFLQIQTLSQQLQLKTKELQLVANQLITIKQLLEQEKQKRRKVQAEKRSGNKQISQLKKSIDSLKIQNKKLHQNIDSLQKQVDFLERINYDQKTRTLISFRQKSLQNQIERLRGQMKQSKTQIQSKLQLQLQKAMEEKYILEGHLKAANLKNQCLQKQLMQNHLDERQFVINSQEYIRLRQKYKSFLDQYKQLRSEYWALKTRVDSQNHNSSSVLSITFSQTDIHTQK